MDPTEWHSDSEALCPVCGFPRGHHYNAFCPTSKGTNPSYDYGPGGLKDAVPVLGPSQPRGRYGVPIDYHPDGSWEYSTDTVITKTTSCNAVKANVGAPINDHVCPHCRNDRVSKVEASCWRCGGKLS